MRAAGTNAIRPARPDDHGHYARLFLELGVPEPPHERDRWVDSYMERTLMLDRDGEVAAYGHYDLLPRCGYVRNIVVAPEHRRQGLGRVMMDALASLFVARGCEEWRLNVKEDNGAAIALYRRCGMEVAYRSTVLSGGRAMLGRLPGPEERVRVRALAPARDGSVEARFAMPVGLLGSVREHPDAELYEVVAGVDGDRPEAECLGVTRFTPSMPGAFPFRLVDARLARPLLTALFGRIEGDERPMTMVCEGDPDTVHALVEAGAKVLFAIDHMRGALPP